VPKPTDLPTILAEYDRDCKELQSGIVTIRNLIVDVLARSAIAVHSVQARVKPRDSLSKKLSRPDARFEALQMVHDVLGLRVITYFEDDVIQVAERLSAEFRVDDKRSGDKAQLLGSREFGYRSLHLVAGITHNRADLPEYIPLRDRIFEIQIRSILQHAWAEIEHDLGYKSQVSIPITLRRRFSRMAGVLEMVDEEFRRIRHSHSAYVQTVTAAIRDASREVELNGPSLAAFLDTEMSRAMDKAIAASVGATVVPLADAEVVNKLVSRMKAIGVTRIDEYAAEVQATRDAAIRFANEMMSGARLETVVKGIGVYYSLFVSLARESEADIRQHLDDFRIGPVSRRELLADRITSLRT
jgi:ppGpp synthetase/RelA/SpoT-type nucleotidyltranferase